MTSLEEKELHVATTRSTSLHVATNQSMEVLCSDDTLNVATHPYKRDTVLDVATAGKPFVSTSTLSVATHEPSSTGYILNDNPITLPVATETESIGDVPQQLLNDELKTNKAAKRTSPPHTWEHTEQELEAECDSKTPSIGSVDKHATGPIMEISHIIKVATEVLCSLEADLQDQGIERPLNLGNSVFPEPIIQEVSTNTLTQTEDTSSMDENVGKYYEVLNPEGDDIMFISNSDIMNNHCTVCAKLLTEADIQLWTKPETKSDGSLIPRSRPNYKKMDNAPEKSSSSDEGIVTTF